MTVRNGERFLREQIDSVLAQTDLDWILTISDDGSMDASTEIIDEYVGCNPGRIRRYYAEKNFGNARDHFFYLMRHCDADHMLFCDQDDVWYPDKIKRIRQIFSDTEKECGSDMPILAFSDQVITDAELNPIAPSLMRYQKQYFGSFDYRSILMQNVVTGGAMGINQSLAKLAGQCTDPSQMIMHDWWLAAVAARFGKIVYIDEPLGVYRQHTGNAVGAKNMDSAEYLYSRFGTFSEIRAAIQLKKVQAGVFHETYRKSLNEEDELFLREFEKPRSGPGFYLKYMNLIHGRFRRVGFLLLG